MPYYQIQIQCVFHNIKWQFSLVSNLIPWKPVDIGMADWIDIQAGRFAVWLCRRSGHDRGRGNNFRLNRGQVKISVDGGADSPATGAARKPRNTQGRQMKSNQLHDTEFLSQLLWTFPIGLSATCQILTGNRSVNVCEDSCIVAPQLLPSLSTR